MMSSLGGSSSSSSTLSLGTTAPQYDVIRQTMHHHRTSGSHAREAGRHQYEDSNGIAGCSHPMEEDSSLDGGYHGGASENETSSSSSFSSSSNGSSRGSASSDHCCYSDTTSSEDSDDQRRHAASTMTSSHSNTRRPLLRIKRIRSNNFHDDSIADYSTEEEEDDDDNCSGTTAIMKDASNEKTSTDGVAPSPLATARPVESTTSSSNSRLLSLDCAVMAHVLTYLDPPSILDTITMPLNKHWVGNYTRNPELWRVLCLLEPFKAQVDDDSDDEDDDDSLHGEDFGGQDCLMNVRYTRYRLTYTSLVKCVRYLVRITDDSRNGRPLTVMGFGNNNNKNDQLIAGNRNLQRFFSTARQVVTTTHQYTRSSNYSTNREISEDTTDNDDDDDALSNVAVSAHSFNKKKKHRSKKRHYSEMTEASTKKPKYGHSKLTSNLLGPSAAGVSGEVELPWSCAIFSIVNWMVGFSHVEGILTMCLKALPLLLEDEQQRVAAQGSGLTDIILRSMVSFPDSATLHTAAYHTIVVLARPIGGREGMLFHSSMVNTNGIFNSSEVGSASGKSGIAVLLDSMRRFYNDEALQAMGCWSLVNIALAPSQQDILIKLGAVDVALTAMAQHKDSAEVQFRALFALINLIIPPSSIGPQEGTDTTARTVAPGPSEESSSSSSDNEGNVDVEQIVELVVGCMKHYSTNDAILNRACLVLHNLSLNPTYHSTMLWTPHCYLMLEWCMKHYPNDHVLQQGALNTIQRLQTTLSRNAALRKRFRASLKSQRPQFREQVRSITVTELV